MDYRAWISRNCKFAQVLPDENETIPLPIKKMEPDENKIVRMVFKALIGDPDARQYTKADVTRMMRGMHVNPLEHQGAVATVMEMLGRWYQQKEQLKMRERPAEPNVGKVWQPPIPGRGY
jgi:hypothetical protein